jgi:hypothetical protein
MKSALLAALFRAEMDCPKEIVMWNYTTTSTWLARISSSMTPKQVMAAALRAGLASVRPF